MSNQLIITQSQRQQIYLHSEKTYPEECCGLLLGKIDSDRKIVTEIWETENSWNNDFQEDFTQISPTHGSKKDRFAIAPETLLKAQKNSRDRGLKIVGIYHSHPDHPAIPSEFDRIIAWPEYSYLIISLISGKVDQVYSWILDESHRFQSEIIVTSTFGSIVEYELVRT
jgi:proteasome lid subunit RPN8/RPN11